MEKVKVTREQAEAIEFAKKNHPNINIVKAYVNYRGWGLCGELDSLKLLEFDDLIKALYIGYEIAPEFKVGDWVVVNGNIGEIEFINVVDGLANISYSTGSEDQSDRLVETFNLKEIERYAAPEEIATEKERRWWAKHGRDVWQLQKGDILWNVYHKEPLCVYEVHNDSVDFGSFVRSLDNVKKECKVACFVKDRLDQ